MKKPNRTPRETAPISFQVFTEIAIIAHLADTAFGQLLPAGITTAQFGVLNHLTRLGASQTISEIASAMQVSQPTMSSTVRKLADKQLVELAPAPEDGRVRMVTITDSGRALRELCVAAAAPLQDLLAQEIPASGWHRLLPELRRIRMALDENRSRD